MINISNHAAPPEVYRNAVNIIRGFHRKNKLAKSASESTTLKINVGPNWRLLSRNSGADWCLMSRKEFKRECLQ
ncbi:ParE family toxin-like protein [Serratia liquefaciens]